MRKYWLLFFSTLLIFNAIQAQLCSWPLTVDGQAQIISPNLTASAFTNGSGTLIFTNGAYVSGWTTSTSPDPTDYFQIAIAPTPGYKLTIQTLAFSERRSLTGPTAYQVQYTTQSDFSNTTTLNTVTIPDNDLERDGTISGLNIIVNSGDTLYIRWYGYGAESSAGTWRINDNSLSVSGSVTVVNTNDNNSSITNPTTQIPASQITPQTSSVFIPVFSFNIIDAGSGDNLPTKVTSLTIKNANSTDWTQTIENIKVKNNGTDIILDNYQILSNMIVATISLGNLIIPDNTSQTIELQIQLDTIDLVDGSQLQFYIDANNLGFDSDISGSGFASTLSQNINSEFFTIDIIAQKLGFYSFPFSVWQNYPFLVQLWALDIFGNVDTDYNQTCNLNISTGNGQLQISESLQFIGGILNLNNVIYTGNEWFKISAIDTQNSFSTISSSLIFSGSQGLILDDNFNEGGFPSNPVWLGNTFRFIINTENQLQLYTTASTDDTAWVSSPVGYTADSLEWQAFIKLNFDPSTNNYTKYFLLSSNPDLKNTQNGYYIQMGESGSTDALEFFKLENGVSTSLFRGTQGLIAVGPEVRIKAIADNLGNWKLFADYTGGTNFQFLGNFSDSTFPLERFFSGVNCRFSASYATEKFNFDDFYCGPVRVDTLKPQLLSITVVDSLNLLLKFSESISSASANQVLNYYVSNGIGYPISINQNTAQFSEITLSFANAFQSDVEYNITISNLSDLSTNLIQTTTAPFYFTTIEKYDVVINEIFSDPSPSVQLPEWEFVELYNRTSFPINLENWAITVGSTSKAFTSVELPANGYVIVCHEDAVSEFQSYGTTAGLFTSTTILTNSGAELILKDVSGNVIHAIKYSDTWHSSAFKKDGGWSLEQIDPNRVCGEQENWKSSTANKGGTPGTVNSVNANNADSQNPQLLKSILIEPDTLMLYFNEILDTLQLLNINSYSVGNNFGNPISVETLDIWNKTIKLIFNRSFGMDTIYTLTVSQQIKDCAGNYLTIRNTARFGVSQIPDSNEIVINEVLFDPLADGVDFIELYNNSTKIFNLSQIQLPVYEGEEISKMYKATITGDYLFPGEYIVLSTNSQQTKQTYYTQNPYHFVDLLEMPSLNNDAGRVTIMNKNFDIIDDFTYTDKMHFQLLSSFDGVSLERINYALPTNDAKNWHSAAENVGYATPAYKNSQFNILNGSNAELTLEPEIFSPDNDGHNDQLYIYYKNEKIGNVANVTIYDSKGRKVRTLIANEMMSQDGYFIWDGLDNQNNKASTGVYVVFVETFDILGDVKSFKRTCVLASKF